MNMEHLAERESAGETEVLEENLPKCHFVNHKSKMTCPGIELNSVLLEASDLQSEIWRGQISCLLICLLIGSLVLLRSTANFMIDAQSLLFTCICRKITLSFDRLNLDLLVCFQKCS
jgi:hypothetical protein